MRVLVTRPEGAAEQTAGKLESMGHEAVLAPLLKTEFLDAPISGLDRAQALVFTSTNGVEGFARITGERALPVYAVGAPLKKLEKTLQLRVLRGSARNALCRSMWSAHARRRRRAMRALAMLKAPTVTPVISPRCCVKGLCLQAVL